MLTALGATDGPLGQSTAVVDADGTAHVKSVVKAARVLRSFDTARTALTVRDIARRTGLPRSTCHAICSTLVAERLLEARSGGGYVLGVELVVMAGHVVARSGLADAAAPIMNALAASTGSEVHLGQLDDDGNIVYLHRVRARRRLRARNRFGLRVPAHTSGCGKAALSQLDPIHVQEILRSRGMAPDRVERLADELETARITGYVVTTSFQDGLASVSAPIVGWDGHVLGGLSVADHRETFNARVIASLGGAVRDAAESVSRQLLGPTRPS